MVDKLMRRLVVISISAVAGGLLLAASVTPGHSADWSPNKPITMLIGFKEGGGADALARLVADHIEKRLGWKIVPQNRGGAGGAVMAELLKVAPADGHTIGMGVTSSFSCNPILNDALRYSHDDFDYLGTIALSQMVIVARSDAPYETLEEMAEYAKSQGSLTIGAMGKILEFVARLIADHYDIELRVMPTRGGAEVLSQVLGGHVHLGFNGGAHHQYIRSGDMKVIVNLNEEPLVLTPDVKNLQDHGIDYAMYSYFQFQGPKGLPEHVKAALAEAIDSAVASDRVRDLAEKRMEMQLTNLGPDRLTSVIRQDVEATKRLLATTK